MQDIFLKHYFIGNKFVHCINLAFMILMMLQRFLHIDTQRQANPIPIFFSTILTSFLLFLKVRNEICVILPHTVYELLITD
jgi:hypothetical protein